MYVLGPQKSQKDPVSLEEIRKKTGVFKTRNDASLNSASVSLNITDLKVHQTNGSLLEQVFILPWFFLRKCM